MSYWNYIPGAAAAVGTAVYTKMYVVGGNHAVADCDEYDASGNSWTSKTNGPAVSSTRQYPGTNTLGDLMYVMGGRDGSPISDTDAYSQAGNSWSTKATFAYAIYAQYSGVCNDKIYYSGGNDGDPDYGVLGLRQETYEYVDDTYTNKSVNGPTKQYVPGMAVGDKLYATHDSGVGEGDTISPSEDNEEYSVSGNSWASKSSALSERADCAGASLGEGASAGYVFSGAHAANTGRVNEEYSVSGNSWTSKTDLPAPDRTKIGAAGI